MTQETKSSYQVEIDDLECPHCNKVISVGLDYSVVIDSPEDIYIEIEDAGVIKN